MDNPRPVLCHMAAVIPTNRPAKYLLSHIFISYQCHVYISFMNNIIYYKYHVNYFCSLDLPEVNRLGIPH